MVHSRSKVSVVRDVYGGVPQFRCDVGRVALFVSISRHSGASNIRLYARRHCIDGYPSPQYHCEIIDRTHGAPNELQPNSVTRTDHQSRDSACEIELATTFAPFLPEATSLPFWRNRQIRLTRSSRHSPRAFG
ncbi:hypothetical protein MRB53_038349 [Persea americana]|nr:hypothetical protein MRB53_038349 [Persea americana]